MRVAVSVRRAVPDAEKAVQLMQAEKWDQTLLNDLCDVMQDASICGLGQAAPNPIRLTMKHFSDEIS